MTAKLALLKRITVLENLPTVKKPLRIIGGLPDDYDQMHRATVKLDTGHIIFRERGATESIQQFLTRIHVPGCVVTLGGLPPLPLDERLVLIGYQP